MTKKEKAVCMARVAQGLEEDPHMKYRSIFTCFSSSFLFSGCVCVPNSFGCKFCSRNESYLIIWLQLLYIWIGIKLPIMLVLWYLEKTHEGNILNLM